MTFQPNGISVNDSESFITTIFENPEDVAPRLIYADWLEEHADPRAEVIRIRSSFQDATTPRRRQLRQRETEINAAHGNNWVDYLGLPLTRNEFISQFRKRLAETIVWHQRSKVLRSPELSPLSPDFFIGEPRRTSRQRQLMVHQLAEERASILSLNHRPLPVAESLARGHLVVFFPDATLSDGAAEAESDGFFDVHNNPAWNYWLWFHDVGKVKGDPSYSSFLISWVPPEFVESAEGGMRVNPEECIQWAGDVQSAFIRLLLGARLLE